MGWHQSEVHGRAIAFNSSVIMITLKYSYYRFQQLTLKSTVEKFDWKGVFGIFWGILGWHLTHSFLPTVFKIFVNTVVDFYCFYF